jgi:hypothetical protein
MGERRLAIRTIKDCSDCPFCCIKAEDFNVTHGMGSGDHAWCEKLDRQLGGDSVDKDCPLPKIKSVKNARDILAHVLKELEQ